MVAFKPIHRQRRLVRALQASLPAVALVTLLRTPGPALGADDLNGEPSYVVVMTGTDYEPGVVVIEDGKITAIGKDLEYPAAAKVVRAPQQTVMPGFVLARSRFGLRGYSRSGVNGDQKAADEVYLDEIDWRELLEAGVTTISYVPDGKGVTGSAAIFRTGGGEENRLLKDDAFLHVAPNWSSGGKKTLRDALSKAAQEIEKVEKARKEWEEKQEAAKKKKVQEANKEKPKDEEKDGEEKGGTWRRSSAGNRENGKEEKPAEKNSDKKKSEPEAFKPPKIDPKYQPLVDLIEKKEGASMMVELDDASDLLHLDDVLEAYDELAHFLFFKPRLERFGSERARFGYRFEYLRSDFYHVVDRLGKRKARVVLSPLVHNLPDTTFRYNLMAELVRAGCEVSVVPRRDSRSELQRLRARLAELVRAGLDKDKALESLSLAPARAVGMGDRLGSLEKEKDADLVFFDGDPLDPHSRIERVMILGETVWEAD